MTHVAINSGDLRQRVNIVDRNSLVDNTGGAAVTESISGAAYWAMIEYVGGREYERGGLMTAEVTHVITMRYFSATNVLTPMDALKQGNRYFEIESIENVGEENVYLRFYCKERIGT